MGRPAADDPALFQSAAAAGALAAHRAGPILTEAGRG